MVISLLLSLAAACHGVVGVACIDPRMRGNGRGVLVQLPSGFCPKIDDTGLLENIRGSDFDPVASLINYASSA